MNGPGRLMRTPHAIWGCLIAALVMSCWLASIQGDFPSDDSLIHVRCAYNYAEYGNVSFNPGEKSYSTTSPLWNAVVGTVARVSGADKQVMLRLSQFVAAAALAAAAAALLLLGKTLYGHWLPPVAILFLLDPYVTVTVHGAMEQPLFMVLGASGLALVYRGKDGSRKALVGAAFIFAVQYAVRPEALAFAGAVGIYLLGIRRWRSCLLFGAAFIVALAPVLALLHRHLESIVPLSLLMKTHDAHGWRPFTATNSSYRVLFLMAQVYAIPLAWLTVLAVTRGRRQWRDCLRLSMLPALVVVLLGGAYLAFLKENAVSSRYLVHFMPFVYLLIGGLLSRIGKPGLTATVTVTLVVYLVALNLLAAPRRVERGLLLEPERIELGTWLRENTPPGASVWTFDIGYIGFHADRRIYDFNLVSSGANSRRDALRKRRGELDLARAVRSSGIEYIIWGPTDLPELPLERVFTSRYEKRAGHRSIYRVVYDDAAAP